MTAHYVFGPVPSRRLGLSLGVDTVPLKTCNWNCVYCQLGRSRPVVNKRREYYPCEQIISEVREALKSPGSGGLDWITFVASGETTLHSGMGKLIRRIKSLTEIPVAVITNGSLLSRPEMRAELAAADAVFPSLDAGDEATYRLMNRAHPDLTFQRHLKGLAAFNAEYDGRFAVEVMLVGGFNDTERSLSDLTAALESVGPDEIHIVTPTRPPAECSVAPPDDATLRRALEMFGKAARIAPPPVGEFDSATGQSALDAVIDIIVRHPMAHAQVERMLERLDPDHSADLLGQLALNPQVQCVDRNGVGYWTAASAFFPDDR